MIIQVSKFTLDYAAYLIYEKIGDEEKANTLFQEAMMWKNKQYSGKADICFELYENHKTFIATRRQMLNDVIRVLDLRVVHYNGEILIDQKVNKKWINVVPDTKTVVQKAEQFISDYILGAYNSTDST